MNSTAVMKKEAVPVRIGALLMYCEGFKAETSRAFSEKVSVSGDTFFTNTGEKALKITFSGRIYDEYVPLRFLLYTHGVLRENTALQISYRGVSFTDCHIQSFSAEDKGEGYIYASVTLVTTSLMSGEEEQSV